MNINKEKDMEKIVTVSWTVEHRQSVKAAQKRVAELEAAGYVKTSEKHKTAHYGANNVRNEWTRKYTLAD
jgi:spore germination cell wall hydrolase CwlJ-like protein